MVTPLVKSVILPTTSLAKFCVPVTTEAAKAPPGSVGIDGVPPLGPPPILGVDLDADFSEPDQPGS